MLPLSRELQLAIESANPSRIAKAVAAIHSMENRLRRYRQRHEILIAETLRRVQHLTVGAYKNVPAVCSHLFIRQIGLQLADESSASFGIVFLYTHAGDLEARLWGRDKNKVHVGLIARQFGGDGDSHYAVIPKMPVQWRFPQDLVSDPEPFEFT